MISFQVIGEPMPQGSMRIGHGKVQCKVCGRGDAYMVPSGQEKLRPWRAAVKSAAASYMHVRQLPVFRVAVELEVIFYLTRRYATDLERDYPSEKPDWDKLARAIGDALSKVVYDDDKRVVDAIVRKRWVESGCPPGARINVRPMPAPQLSLELGRQLPRAKAAS